MAELPVTRPVLLVADDDHDFRCAVAEGLRGCGYEVVEAADGSAALAHALRRPFDAILTDLRMPGLDGLELLRRLEDVQPGSAFVFISGQARIEDVVAALRHGRAFDFLFKPIRTFAEVETAVSKALEARPRLATRSGADLPGPALIPDASRFLADAGSLVGRTLRYMSLHFRDHACLPAACAHVGYSPNYLTGVLRRETGLSLHRWITGFRLAAARYLLAGTDLPVSRVAAEIGMSDGKSFVRLFRRVHAQTPADWRLAARSAIGPKDPGE